MQSHTKMQKPKNFLFTKPGETTEFETFQKPSRKSGQQKLFLKISEIPKCKNL